MTRGGGADDAHHDREHQRHRRSRVTAGYRVSLDGTTSTPNRERSLARRHVGRSVRDVPASENNDRDVRIPSDLVARADAIAQLYKPGVISDSRGRLREVTAASVIRDAVAVGLGEIEYALAEVPT
jgi:hypothetical protein